jgi:hypothetical protein
MVTPPPGHGYRDRGSLREPDAAEGVVDGGLVEGPFRGCGVFAGEADGVDDAVGFADVLDHDVVFPVVTEIVRVKEFFADLADNFADPALLKECRWRSSQPKATWRTSCSRSRVVRPGNRSCRQIAGSVDRMLTLI